MAGLDWCEACSWAGIATGEDGLAVTSGAVCVSPSAALGEGKDSWGVVDCALAERMASSFSDDWESARVKGCASGCAGGL